MIDYITNAILSNLAVEIENNLGTKLIFRESPNFNFSEEMKKAISADNIKQTVMGNKQAMLLAMYQRTGVRLSDIGVRHTARHQNHRFNTTKNFDVGLEKKFITGTWEINVRIACSLKDVIEGLELNYLYYVRPRALTTVGIEIDTVAEPIKLDYTTHYSPDIQNNYADFPNYGSMYILSFSASIVGNLFLPQATYYPKIKRSTKTYHVGRSNENRDLFAVEKRTWEYNPERTLISREIKPG